MPLTLEISPETEARLRAVAEQQGRELGDTILAALEKASDEETRAAQLAGMDEIVRFSEELGLYNWKIDVDEINP